MREREHSLRERGRAARTRGGSLRAFVRRHRTNWMLAVAAAILMGGVGAFGTGQAAPWTLYSYWGILALAGAAIGAAALDVAAERHLFRDQERQTWLAVTSVVTIFMLPLVWVMSAWALNGSWRLARLLDLAPQVLLLAGPFVALQMFTRNRPDDQAAATSVAEPRTHRLADRLPGRLRGAELHAIEAEDHYLRLHTAHGSALILMRLTDAMAELSGIEGARTHRSWWVARDAVIDAVRGRGRAVLRLKNGLTAPVSRTYAPALRAAHWY